MIKYALKCSAGHQFESWFQNSEAFDRLQGAGQLSCVICGAVEVEKAVMAPRVTANPSENGSEDGTVSLSTPMSEVETALAKIREHVESTAEHVGGRFVEEVRAIHDGEAPERAIYGEAKIKDAAELISEGIPVAPLPWAPRRPKVN